MSKEKIYGFGFNPLETEHHFLIDIPPKNGKIKIYERFLWDKGQQETYMKDKNLKIIISKKRFNKIKPIIKKEFNRRLRNHNLPKGNFETGKIPVERLLGKELVLLLWGIEDADINLFNVAIKNWNGFAPEERWWLFTMTNASTGNYKDKRGWRIGLRYILTENPVDDKLAGSFIERLI